MTDSTDAPRPTSYLGIDGVLLRRRSGNLPARDVFRVAQYARHFIIWSLKHCDVRWLSSRCQAGDARDVCEALRLAFALPELPKSWQFIANIPAARWERKKTDAMDLSGDSYWLDTDHGEEALAVLTANGKTDRAIEVSVDRDPKDLPRATRILLQPSG